MSRFLIDLHGLLDRMQKSTYHTFPFLMSNSDPFPQQDMLLHRQLPIFFFLVIRSLTMCQLNHPIRHGNYIEHQVVCIMHHASIESPSWQYLKTIKIHGKSCVRVVGFAPLTYQFWSTFFSILDFVNYDCESKLYLKVSLDATVFYILLVSISRLRHRQRFSKKNNISRGLDFFISSLPIHVQYWVVHENWRL